MRIREQIQEGFMVFAADSANGIGSVCEVRLEELLVYIENAGDFVLPLSNVRVVHWGKVVLDLDRLEPSLRKAIDHVHDDEDPFYEEAGAKRQGALVHSIKPRRH